MNKNNTAGRSKASLTATLAAGMMLASDMSNKPGLGKPGNRPINIQPVASGRAGSATGQATPTQASGETG